MSRERIARRREENEVEFSRIVAFSDGVFAIAITLLVLNLSVPEQIPGDDLDDVLWDQRHDLLAYVISFAVIGRFWILHHRFFASVIGFDARLLGWRQRRDRPLRDQPLRRCSSTRSDGACGVAEATEQSLSRVWR